MVSDQWRELTSEEKEKWEVMAREDKARYLKQKEEYAGPWKVPADMKKPKDPTAPKKPTPAYFSFSNERRQSVKKENPTASNGEISKILSKMWKDAEKETRAKYVEKEKKERDEYNKAVDQWKKQRKESGQNNWWEVEQPPETGGRKRQKLDLLASTAGAHPQHAEPGSSASLLPDERGGISLAPSIHDQLSALAAQQGNGSFLASLIPTLVGQGTFGRNALSVNMQVASHLQPGGTGASSGPLGGEISLGGLFGSSPTGVIFQNNGLPMSQSTLLASLLGGTNVAQQQQQQQQPPNSQGMNEILLSSLLSGAIQQQPQNLHSLQSSLLQQRLSGGTMLHQHDEPGNPSSALASLLGQQQQRQMTQSSQSTNDQMLLLQNLLQQQGGSGNSGLFQQQQHSIQKPPSNALEGALARFVSGNGSSLM